MRDQGLKWFLMGRAEWAMREADVPHLRVPITVSRDGNRNNQSIVVVQQTDAAPRYFRLTLSEIFS
jgi:hypothetical protein